MAAPSSTRFGHPFTFLQLPFPSSLIKIHQFVIPRPLHGYAAAIQIPELLKVEVGGGRGGKENRSGAAPAQCSIPVCGAGTSRATAVSLLPEALPGRSSSPLTRRSLVERTSCTASSQRPESCGGMGERRGVRRGCVRPPPPGTVGMGEGWGQSGAETAALCGVLCGEGKHAV